MQRLFVRTWGLFLVPFIAYQWCYGGSISLLMLLVLLRMMYVLIVVMVSNSDCLLSFLLLITLCTHFSTFFPLQNYISCCTSSAQPYTFLNPLFSSILLYLPPQPLIFYIVLYFFISSQALFLTCTVLPHFNFLLPFSCVSAMFPFLVNLFNSWLSFFLIFKMYSLPFRPRSYIISSFLYFFYPYTPIILVSVHLSPHFTHHCSNPFPLPSTMYTFLITNFSIIISSAIMFATSRMANHCSEAHFFI